MVVLVRIAAAGRGLLYTFTSFSGQSDFASQKSCICAVTHVTKSACPTDAEKCLPTTICPHSRWRSQPLSRVSRKQRYNTLDFASKIVCQQGCYAPLLETPRQWDCIPLDTCNFLHTAVPKLKKYSLPPVRRKYKRKHLRHDSESANLPFGADNLKLDMVQFQIISLCYGRGLNLQIQNSALINIDSERNLEYG